MHRIGEVELRVISDIGEGVTGSLGSSCLLQTVKARLSPTNSTTSTMNRISNARNKCWRIRAFLR
jgi:hypothetical protein